MNSSLRQGMIATLLAGSLGLANATTVHVMLTGAHEVPPVQTSARGTGVVRVESNGKVSGAITTFGLKVTMAHIHIGPVDSNGPPIIWLKRGPHDTWAVPSGAKLTAAQYKSFLAGELYINVHSLKHPAGEIRGQLLP